MTTPERADPIVSVDAAQQRGEPSVEQHLRRAIAQTAAALQASRDAEVVAVLERLRADAQRAIVRNLGGRARQSVHPRRRPVPARPTSVEIRR
jgi:hypothetical protein